MRKSFLLKALLAAAFPLFATEDETASAAPSSTDAAQEQPATDATAAAEADAAAPNADAAPVVASEAPVTSGAPTDEPLADTAPVGTGNGDAVATTPIVQTPTPVAQSGGVDDPVLETVKTPAHNVAEEIQEQIKKLEQLPAEVAAWFESKFIELAGHIKALL